ncbi:ATP-dependent DNA helicase RecG [Paenibacillus baekrokdamisoli]|uniref:DNA 3'-5' helicase n=1 Tax=Paenibacillus baekrokdamisoli TaxID=1712516 RepID=A0A3G9IVJ1_9BACL|nr:RecQ family ATP-dependent DNA helicase [Paenibacillus baekrokdamisoli]MBB3068472.1 ATP-dependent DNA helicase RecQ [Paenibacillus baekrokdamisoli]BBH22486.1 ATP-dependent DNA helicase RecG [Paenibacillus baekrokdamisoli]
MLLESLRQVFGAEATFRDGQDVAIENVINKKRVLVVQKTGWGKSLVYFLATKIMRQIGDGATLIISPLLALTRNQIDSTKNYGIVADCINSQINKTFEEREKVINRCNNGQCDVLFITPEQLQFGDFIELLSRLKVGLLVVDEAHCISDWGHDFRPDYRRIHQLLQILPQNISVLATTATANERVIADVSQQIGDCEIIRGELQRESLYLHKLYLPTAEEKFAWIAKNINKFHGSGIIYATTIRECERLAAWLRHNAINANAYHSDLNEEDKITLETNLINNEIKVLVSTIALGMGYDKEDISFVFHYYTPKSVIEHYQQIGRAGRGIDKAFCVLLYGGAEENKINEYFIYSSFPQQKQIIQVLNFIDNHDEVKKSTIEQEMNIKPSILDQIIKLLLIDGLIMKDSRSRYSRTIKPYFSKEEYYDSVINMKMRDYQELINFQKTNDCQMEFLTKALDDPNAHPCGKCSTCLGFWKWTDDILVEKEINKVSDFFEKSFIIIEPRKKSAVTNRKLLFMHENGLALSYYHELLGQEASRGKYVDNYFSDVLVKASADKLKRFFRDQEIRVSDLTIIPIPSNRRQKLVPEFAQRLANTLQCKYAHILAKRPNEPEQKASLNSRHQEQGIRDYLYIHKDVNLNTQQILLVDDFVDSKWTFTVATELLGETFDNISVTPFALAVTSGSD